METQVSNDKFYSFAITEDGIKTMIEDLKRHSGNKNLDLCFVSRLDEVCTVDINAYFHEGGRCQNKKHTSCHEAVLNSAIDQIKTKHDKETALEFSSLMNRIENFANNQETLVKEIEFNHDYNELLVCYYFPNLDSCLEMDFLFER